MPNEVALNFITDKITALQLITQELGRIFLGISDLDEADAVRSEITSINQVLFALQSARNSLEATAHEVPPPSPARIQSLTVALQQLDGFVSSDENIQATITFLTQLASQIRNT